MSAVDEHAEAHRLKGLGYGARRIAQELGISRYAAGELLRKPLAAPVADRPQPVAGVVGHLADHSPAAVGQTPGPPAEERRLVLDLDEWPGLAQDLADLMRVGASAQQVVDFAVGALAETYRNAVAIGVLAEGGPFGVTEMRIRPARRPPDAP